MFRPSPGHPRRSTVVVNVRPSVNVVAHARAASRVGDTAPRVIGVSPAPGIGCPRPRKHRLHRVALRGISLGPGHGQDDVGGRSEVDLILPPVLGAQAVQPGAVGGLDQDAALCGNVDAGEEVLGVAAGYPVPHVFGVDGGSSGEVHAQVGGLARVGVVGAAPHHVQGAPESPDVDDGVPYRDVAWLLAVRVELEDDGAWRDVGNGEAHVLDMDRAHVANFADLHDGLGVFRIRETRACPGYGRPRLAVYTGSNWYDKRRGNTVVAKGKVHNLVLSDGVLEDLGKGPNVIRHAISPDGMPTILLRVFDVYKIRPSAECVIRGRVYRDSAAGSSYS